MDTTGHGTLWGRERQRPSALLHMMAGPETVRGGELHLDERVADGLQPSERDIAMVFQRFSPYLSMNTARNGRSPPPPPPSGE